MKLFNHKTTVKVALATGRDSTSSPTLLYSTRTRNSSSSPAPSTDSRVFPSRAQSLPPFPPQGSHQRQCNSRRYPPSPDLQAEAQDSAWPIEKTIDQSPAGFPKRRYPQARRRFRFAGSSKRNEQLPGGPPRCPWSRPRVSLRPTAAATWRNLRTSQANSHISLGLLPPLSGA